MPSLLTGSKRFKKNRVLYDIFVYIQVYSAFYNALTLQIEKFTISFVFKSRLRSTYTHYPSWGGCPSLSIETTRVALGNSVICTCQRRGDKILVEPCPRRALAHLTLPLNQWSDHHQTWSDVLL